MSGGSKKTTIGYWFRLLYHFGLVRGPVDAFLEFRAGDRTAWKGSLTQSGRIPVNQPGLWGGEESEGGLQGDLDVMFGEANQGPNDYLAAHLGADQPTYRGKVTAVWRGGRWGALNPYPKKPAFKVQRILKGWDNDQPWYPEKAAISFVGTEPLAVYFALDISDSMAGARIENMKTAVSAVLNLIASRVIPYGVRVDLMIAAWSTGTPQTILRRNAAAQDVSDLLSWLAARVINGDTDFASGMQAMPGFFDGADPGGAQILIFVTDGKPIAGTEVTAKAILDSRPAVKSYAFNIDLGDTSSTAFVDNTPEDGVPVVFGGSSAAMEAAISRALFGLKAMNPAHILYDSITASDMLGEPVGMIDTASFSAAANKLFAEGFGLCTEYDAGSEDIESFQQRICDIIGAALTQSRIDGKYYLDLIRGDYVLSSLPVVTADDIIEFTHEPTIPAEQVNQVTVEWFDPERKMKRTTAPVHAAGAIQAAGGVIPVVKEYPEIPYEALAIAVAERDLRVMSAPTSRFRLTLNRRRFDMRPGRPFRLQYPDEGIADMVCVVGEVDTGTLLDGRLRVVAVQDVYGFSNTSYISAADFMARPVPDLLQPSPHQLLIEAPYIELVSSLSRADLSVLPSDIGFLATAAVRTDVGLNYVIASAVEDEEFVRGVSADWCPSALINEAAGYRDTGYTISAGTDLQSVQVGTWAVWGTEIVRVDAIDEDAGTLVLGRACADTVPVIHPAASRIFFCSDWLGTDEREYLDGDLVQVKLLTRNSSQELAPEAAPLISLEIVGRQFRPYPPGRLRINDQAYPAIVEGPLTVSWAHRDRLLQDDKLIDNEMTSIGPEPGTTYTVRVRSASTNSVLAEHTTENLSADLAPTIGGDVYIELFSSRSGLQSWQMHRHRCLYSLTEFRVTEDGELRVTEGADYRVLEDL